jgi:hypothetical protein
LGQSTTAAISGTVEDATAVSVVGATVKLIFTDRGTESIATTNERGSFSFPSVSPGHYKLQIERDGFDTTQLTDITLSVNESKFVNIELKVGGTHETVTVNGNALTLDRLSTSVDQVINQQAVRDLPLNTRNFSQLITLSTGTVPDNTQSSGLSISSGRGTTTAAVNGAPTNGNNYRVDTLDNSDNHNGTTSLIYPPVEAIQEFRITSSVANAEFGDLGATISVLYKSGTRELHGDVFEFLRNSKHLDAKGYFDPKGPIKPFHFNNYGVTIGGPVILPHFNRSHEKLFFFFSWEGARVSQSLTYTSTVPLSAFANGDFSAYSQTIYDPRTTTVLPNGTISRRPLPGNQIPANIINQTGLNLLKLFPAPQNTAFVNNYNYTPALTNKHDYFDLKLDSPITEKDSVFYRVSHQNSAIFSPGSLPSPAVGNGADNTNSFPVWQLAAGYTRVIHPTLINEAHAGVTRLFISALNGGYGQNLSTQLGIPGVNVAGDLNTSGLSSIVLAGYPTLGDYTYAPATWSNNNLQFNDNITWVHGPHNVKFGGEYLRRQENFFEGSSVRGSFSFGPTYSTNPATSGATGSSIADLLLGATTSANMNFPIGRTGRRRTDAALYLEDTWQVNDHFTINLGLRWDYLPNWAEARNRFAYWEPQAGDIYNVGTPQIPWSSGVKGRYNDFGPRIGFTYAATPQTIVRGAFGLFHAPIYCSTCITGDTNPPFSGSTQYSNDAGNFGGARLISDGFTRPTSFSAVGASLVGMDADKKTQSAMQFNLGIQQALPGDSLFKLNYVGTLGRSLLYGLNANQPIPGPGAVALRRPYPQYGDINVVKAMGSSNYNSLQTTLEKRIGRSIEFLVAYTWSHALDYGGSIGALAIPANSYDVAAEYGNSNYNIANRLVVSGVFGLPFGRGMKFGSGMSPLINAAFGGWKLSTIANGYNGLPFTPTSSINTLNNGGTQRPNRVGTGLLPNSKQSLTHWFDTTAFVTPALYQFGNSGRNILRGPDTKTVDASLFKTFELGRNPSHSCEFRADLFNISNTPQFNNPAVGIGSVTAGVISSAGSPVTFQRTSRQIQLSGKVNF